MKSPPGEVGGKGAVGGCRLVRSAVGGLDANVMHQIRSAQEDNSVNDAMGEGFMMLFGGDDKLFVSLQLTGT